METKYLPIGTVCTLKGKNKKVMITGYYSVKFNGSLEIDDYSGCVYPEGLLLPEQICTFDNDDIESVDFLGYINDEQRVLEKKLEELMNNNTNEIISSNKQNYDVSKAEQTDSLQYQEQKEEDINNPFNNYYPYKEGVKENNVTDWDIFRNEDIKFDNSNVIQSLNGLNNSLEENLNNESEESVNINKETNLVENLNEIQSENNKEISKVNEVSTLSSINNNEIFTPIKPVDEGLSTSNDESIEIANNDGEKNLESKLNITDEFSIKNIEEPISSSINNNTFFTPIESVNEELSNNNEKMYIEKDNNIETNYNVKEMEETDDKGNNVLNNGVLESHSYSYDKKVEEPLSQLDSTQIIEPITTENMTEEKYNNEESVTETNNMEGNNINNNSTQEYEFNENGELVLVTHNDDANTSI